MEKWKTRSIANNYKKLAHWNLPIESYERWLLRLFYLGWIVTKSQWLKHDYKVTLKKFYKWYCKEDNPELTKWIKITVKKKDQRLPEDMLIESDVLKLIEYAKHQRDKAMIALLWDIGARIGEIGTLNIRHLSFDEYGAIVNVRGKTGYRPD